MTERFLWQCPGIQILGPQYLGPAFLQGSDLGSSALTSPFLMYLLIQEAPCPPLLTSTKILHQLPFPASPSAPTVLFQGCLPFEFVKQTYTYLNLPRSINWHQAPNPVFRFHTNGIILYISFLSGYCNSAWCLWDSPTKLCLSGVHCVFLLSSVPLYEYTTVCLPTNTWMNILVLSNLELFVNKVCITIYMYICR